MRAIPSKHPPGVVGIICGDLARYTHAMRAIAHTQVPDKTNEYWQQGTNVADSINIVFRSALAHEMYQWVWLMGDDHVYAPALPIALLNRNVDVVVPLCLNRYPPFDPTIRHVTGGLKFLEELPTSGLYELGEGETVGDAGMLIRRRVLEAIGDPWYDRLRHGSLGVDDQEFIAKVKRAGFKVYVDIDNRIGHMSPFIMTPVVDDKGAWHVHLACGTRPVTLIQPNRQRQAADAGH
jgi:hypothetical protein